MSGFYVVLSDNDTFDGAIAQCRIVSLTDEQELQLDEGGFKNVEGNIKSLSIKQLTDFWESHPADNASYDDLPMKAFLDAYVKDRRGVGHFLGALLSNNLMEAYNRADSTNKNWIPLYVRYIYNQLPMDCWGSIDKVHAWLSKEVS